MAPNTIQDFQNLCFSPFNSESFLGVRDSTDADVNFFNSVPKEHTKYFSADGITVELNSSENDAFSILHLNKRTQNKNFEKFKNILSQTWLRISNYLLH